MEKMFQFLRKTLRSLHITIYSNSKFSKRIQYFGTINMLIKLNNWDVETYKNQSKKRYIFLWSLNLEKNKCQNKVNRNALKKISITIPINGMVYLNVEQLVKI